MPSMDSAVPLPVPTAQMSSWKPLHRIENTGGNVSVVTDAIWSYPFERLIYAEGDSWFDRFTPIPIEGTNLLTGLRLPVFAGVMDVSRIGDISSEMVAGWQRQTRATSDLFDFDAILLSAGGNDLKNLLAELYQALGDQKLGIKVMGNAVQLKSLESGQLLDDFFDDVLNSIKAFIGLRDAAGSARTRAAPLIMHGYDYLQPRPAPAKTLLGRSWARDLGCIPPASMPV